MQKPYEESCVMSLDSIRVVSFDLQRDAANVSEKALAIGLQYQR